MQTLLEAIELIKQLGKFEKAGQMYQSFRETFEQVPEMSVENFELANFKFELIKFRSFGILRLQ